MQNFQGRGNILDAQQMITLLPFVDFMILNLSNDIKKNCLIILLYFSDINDYSYQIIGLKNF